MNRLALCLFALTVSVFAAPVHVVEESPVSLQRIDERTVLIDFGKVAFGNLQVNPSDKAGKKLTVHFGEDLRDGRVNRKPPGTVRYAVAQVEMSGNKPVRVAPTADKRNTQQGNRSTPPAILTPPEWGVILPFRWVEIEGSSADWKSTDFIRKSAYASTWDDDAASFHCSDEMLNRIWELCRHSIKATTFAGVYVDGDRERIPYEADAYINQLCHYATDKDSQMARDTFDHLMKHPTWPTEWAFHMIFMAHADYRHTGDTAWLAARYASLKPKLLLDRAREDGLLTSNEENQKKTDIVDWPKSERDGFVFTPVNTVVNAFHIRSLQMMAEMAAALGKAKEAKEYSAMAGKAHASFQRVCFDHEQGRYRDGEGTDHASQHASLFPLAFGLVPEEHSTAVVESIVKRGMACSVYAAQYLMEGLFSHGQGNLALELIRAPGDRSWRHMVESGATITWEAWDMRYKPNQDWNHAWGAAPANLFPRYVLGATALEAGWKKAEIRPHTGSLTHARGKIPTPRGSITVDWTNTGGFRMNVSLPQGMSARIDVPAASGSSGISLHGQPIRTRRVGARWLSESEYSGSFLIEVK